MSLKAREKIQVMSQLSVTGKLAALYEWEEQHRLSS